MVADRDALDVRTELDDFAGRLVPERRVPLVRRDAADVGVQRVGAADAACLDLQQHVTRSWSERFDLRPFRDVGCGHTNRFHRGEPLRAMLVSPAGMNGRLKRLAAGGWIMRQPSTIDGRSGIVKLSDRGRAELEAMLPGHNEFERGPLAALDETDFRQLQSSLRVLLLDIEDDH